MNTNTIRAKWAAVGAAIAVSLGAGGIGITQAMTSSGEKPIYLPIEPCRLSDTRVAFQVGPRSAPLGPNETYTLSGHGTVGNCNLPTGSTALSLNVTAIDATAPTFVSLFPAGAPLPVASHLNPLPGQGPVPNAVNVDLNSGGNFSIYNLAGNVNIFIDVVGVYDDHNHDDRYYQKGQVEDLVTPKITRIVYNTQSPAVGPASVMTKLHDIGSFSTSGGTVRLTMTSSGGVRDGSDADTTLDGTCVFGLRVDGLASAPVTAFGGFSGSEVYILGEQGPLVLIDIFEDLPAGQHDLDLYYRNPSDGCADNIGVFPQMVVIEEYPD